MQCRFVVLCLLCIASPLMAQGASGAPPQSTSAIPESRFEMVQSPLNREFTFRLDRYTGKVWQLTNVGSDTWQWEETPVPNMSQVSSPTRPRFQLLVSNAGPAHALLIDTEIGATWQFTNVRLAYQPQRTRNGYGWEPLLER